MAVGAGVTLGSLTSCASFPVYTTSVRKKEIAVPLSLFVDQNIRIIRAKELGYDIALRKENDGQYTALLLRCTHASNSLTYTGSEFRCPLHGSRFDEEGGVTRGPATTSLSKLATKISDEAIVIGVE